MRKGSRYERLCDYMYVVSLSVEIDKFPYQIIEISQDQKVERHDKFSDNTGFTTITFTSTKPFGIIYKDLIIHALEEII